MITLEKAKVYARFHGDGDMYLRLNQSPNPLFDNTEWKLIDSLVQDYAIVKNGYGSAQFINELNKKASINCDGTETIDFIKSLAG